MNAPLRKIDFTPRPEPKLFRPEHLTVSRRPAGERAISLLVTIAAHAAVGIALVLGFHAATPFMAPPPIMVSVQEKVEKHEKLEIVLPKFTPAQQVTAQAPLFDIAPNPNAINAAPPKPAPTPTTPPSPGPARDSGESRATYLGALLAQLNRFKHYPPEAKSAHIEGAVLVHFVMDRSGKVLSSGISKSSGRPALDREALAILARAQPLLAMPAEISGDTLDAEVSINFSLHG